MKNWVQTHSGRLSPERLSEAIFSGSIIFFESIPLIADLVREVQQLLSAAFEPHTPESAHGFLASDKFQTRFGIAQEQFRTSVVIRQNVYGAFDAVGARLSDTFCDRLRLRASPPHYYDPGAPFLRSSTPAHRDSWGSAVTSQINWWLPVFPLHPDRTLAIYPAHWSKPIANDAEGWDWKCAGKEGKPRMPTAQGPIDDGDEIRITVEPGTLVAFSASHLHAGVLNTTGLTRFSVETRTINVEDLVAKRGAPTIDGLGARPGYEWFRRVTDGQALAEVIKSA